MAEEASNKGKGDAQQKKTVITEMEEFVSGMQLKRGR